LLDSFDAIEMLAILNLAFAFYKNATNLLEALNKIVAFL
jgi:hypothetical protein